MSLEVMRMKKSEAVIENTSKRIYDLLKNCDKRLIETLCDLIEFICGKDNFKYAVRNPHEKLFLHRHQPFLNDLLETESCKQKRCKLLRIVKNDSFEPIMSTILYIFKSLIPLQSQ